jgi:subfamily B ATP-binding cassette protein MsbA
MGSMDPVSASAVPLRPLVGWRIYRRLLARVRPQRASILLAIAASTVAAAAAAVYAYLLGPLIKALLTGGALRLGPFSLDHSDLVWRIPAGLVALAGVKAISQYLQTGLMQSAGQRFISGFRADLYRRLLNLPPDFFEKRHSGELLSRFTSDVAQVEFAVTQALASYARDFLQVLALLATCLVIDARLFPIVFVVLPGAAYPISRFARALKRITRRTQESLGKQTELLVEQLQNLPIVQSYRSTASTLSRFSSEQVLYLSAMSRSLLLRGLVTPTLEFLGLCATGAVIGLGARAVSLEAALAPKLVSFVAASLLLYQPLKSLSGTFSSSLQGLGAAQRLFEIADEAVPSDGQREAMPLRHQLRIDGLTAFYSAGTEVLQDLSMVIPAGKRVALVGPSGAGKTTLFSILLRFVAPTGGSIYWDDADLTELRIPSVRGQLAWVPQEPVLFSGTVRHNLLLGRADATEPEIWEALRRAHAESFVKRLPLGLEEQVGERGGLLSGGERQRLAIARAFLRGPSLLLLDEPTSALDAAAELEVQRGLAELMRGRTSLVIAHRLSTVRGADLIYVLDGGKVVEQGTHAELSAKQGRYASLLQQGEVGISAGGGA